MRKSFYTWLMAQRNPKSNEPVAILADLAFEDSTFLNIQMTSKKSVATWKIKLVSHLILVSLIRFGKTILLINND